jgi:hypothetical protein
VEACPGAVEDSGLALVRHMGSWDPFQKRIVVAAELAGAVAVAEADAEEEHFQAAESAAAADAVVANDLGAAHSAAVGHPGVEDSAAVAVAAVAQEEKWAAEDMIDRLAEAQSTAVDPAVGLSSVSVLFRNVDTKQAHHNHPSLVVLHLISRYLSAPRMLLTRVKVTTWWWTAVS